MSEWIRYVDRIPLQGQAVLAYAGEIFVAEYWIHQPETHDADTGFFDRNQDEIFPVTHWQPAPGPPTS